MKFDVTQRLQGSMDEVERALLDPRYPEFLLKHHSVLLEVQVLDVKDLGDKVQRKVRYRPQPVIKSVGPRQVPPEWFAFVETSTWDKKRKELTFQNVPTSNSIAHLLINTGTLRLRDLGNGQTERTMNGEINLKLPFLLKPVALIGEKMIQAEGLKILDGEVPVMNRFINEVLRQAA
jgi:hypothetical protein